jgi:DNA-binding GntR family transcriptional regulator
LRRFGRRSYEVEEVWCQREDGALESKAAEQEPTDAASAPKGAGSTVAYKMLSRKILSLEFPPGMLLEEPRLVKMLGLSRTPLREALIRLRTEGLIVQTSNQTATVAPLDIAALRHYFEAVDVAQRTVSRWAALRRSGAHLADIRAKALAYEGATARRDSIEMIELNRDFHVAIAEAAGNEFFLDLSIRLYNQGLRVGRMSFVYDFDHNHLDHFDRIVADHRGLVDAIEAADADRAEALAGEHAKLGRERTISNLSKSF